MDTEPPCSEKVRLLLEFKTAAEEYADAIRDLKAKAAISEDTEKLKRIADYRRVSVEERNLALDTHASKHGF